MRKIVFGLLLAAAGLAQQMESFEAVWTAVADKHWSPEQLKQIGWNELKEPYRRRVAAAGNQSEVRQILREMVGKIGKSHYAISGLEMRVSPKVRQGGGNSPGFRVGLVEGKVVTTGLEPGVSDVRMGWEVVEVDGRAVAPAVVEIQKQVGEGLQSGLRLHQMLQVMVSGSPGEELAFAFEGLGGVKHKVVRKVAAGNGSTGFGFVQGVNVGREYRRVGARRDIGYFRLDLFLDVVRVLPQFQKAVEDCRACRGFIIDLRGNPGGLAVMANALAGWFVQKEDVKLGTMYQRGVELKFVVIPRLGGFAGPLAILVDEASASTSEIFAGGMQDLGRARILGERTAGAALPSVVESLPNGDLFQFAVANYVSESGRELEGMGVKPDQVVRHTLAALRAGRDRPLEAAISWVYASAVRSAGR
jgi:carboxyl-terminal processing protease